MTLKEAKQIVKNHYPKATCHYRFSSKMDLFSIRETHNANSPMIGVERENSSTAAWKDAAKNILQGEQ